MNNSLGKRKAAENNDGSSNNKRKKMDTRTGRFGKASQKFFVFLKVLKKDLNSKLIYQKELLINELKIVFENSPQISLQPNEMEIKKLKEIASIKRRPIDGNCSVCQEPMNNNENLIWCQRGCGNNIRYDYFVDWKEQKGTCVYCRTEWKDKM
ncbi:hypothetical protein Glove_19g146 [Diversispora epigaea]|uniref:RING-type domain-containing protein n=1 Tax=Diversispora epigaea TaxID=1348612 RepID=A0A397JKP4_9GLOM|nr:hypothetical protein Glove_19g146 [Diversispora epigaea]